MKRLFAALPVEGEIIKSLQEVYRYFAGQRAYLKPVLPEHYHITVKFFGECAPAIAKSVEDGFRTITVDTGRVPFKITGLGAFPNPWRANVLWLRIDADLALIGRIKDRVEKLSSALGFKGEVRDFIPHLTVARARKGVALPEELVRYVEQRGRTLLGESFFSRLVLYSSKLTPDGPLYRELYSVSL